LVEDEEMSYHYLIDEPKYKMDWKRMILYHPNGSPAVKFSIKNTQSLIKAIYYKHKNTDDLYDHYRLNKLIEWINR